MKARLSLCLSIFALLIIFDPCALLAEACGRTVLQLGWFSASQGKSQHINIESLIGDDFSLTKSTDQNFLIGVGYYFDCLDRAQMHLSWGLNAFFLSPTKVKGNVTQEGVSTNLSYQYSLTHCPLYLATKALIHCCSRYDLVLDLGIGPNIVHTGGFKERSLDGGITIPDNPLFSGKNSVRFSATAGLGWRINEVCGNHALEISYRFFYLGQSELRKNNNQLRNNLHTGHCYANALFLSISL